MDFQFSNSLPDRKDLLKTCQELGMMQDKVSTTHLQLFEENLKFLRNASLKHKNPLERREWSRVLQMAQARISLILARRSWQVASMAGQSTEPVPDGIGRFLADHEQQELTRILLDMNLLSKELKDRWNRLHAYGQMALRSQWTLSGLSVGFAVTAILFQVLGQGYPESWTSLFLIGASLCAILTGLGGALWLRRYVRREEQRLRTEASRFKRLSLSVRFHLETAARREKRWFEEVSNQSLY